MNVNLFLFSARKNAATEIFTICLEGLLTPLKNLTDGIFETGACEVPSKSQNPTVLYQCGPSSTQYSNHSWTFCWRHLFGTNNYTVHKSKYVFIPALDFLFFDKIRLEITNIWCGVSGNFSKQKWRCQNGSKMVPRV